MNKMKKTILVLFIAAMATAPMQAMKVSEKKVPAQVMSAFMKKYPEAKHACWSKNDASTAYEVKFKDHGQRHEAMFDNDGDWRETSMCVKKDELPAQVQATLSSDFSDYRVKKTEMVMTPKKGTYYEAEVKNDGQTWDVSMNAQGKVIDKEIADKSDNMSEYHPKR